MALQTRLTRQFDLRHPVISAPMALAAGGALAAAVSNGGGLGLIGGGYGDRPWLEEQFRLAGNAQVGYGFITWSLRDKPGLLASALDRKPAALFLSFDDPRPYARAIADAGVPLICQVQTMRDAAVAIECGAAIIVAQGSEAGGHGEVRGTMAFVPEVADLLARRAPATLLCAAGGIADGRGLAASLMLGADGVVVGSRFWASEEALVHPNHHARAVAASGDDTIRSKVPDLARRLPWPERFNIRVLRNDFTQRWHGHEGALIADADEQAALWRAASLDGDTSIANTIVGEAVGLIDRIEPARAILDRMVAEAEQLIDRGPSMVVAGV